MTKIRFVEDLAEGESVEELFLVKAARLGETRAGKPYLALTVGDRTGEINGPVWENVAVLQEICSPGNVVKIKAMVQVYRDNLQLRIENVREADPDSYELGSFVEASHRSMAAMGKELGRIIDSVSNAYLRKLLNEVFAKSEEGTLFRQSPAAKGIHHAYLGGLLEHSLSMAGVAQMLADHYAGIDKDLLVTGALLHDIGKTEELKSDSGVIDYTDVGRLKGHLVIGCELIGRKAAGIKGFPADLLTRLQHLVLSHHGRQEFGSPVVPMTPEALLLSFVDDMDAKMNLIEQLRRKRKSGASGWSDYQRSLERYLLLTPLDENPREDVATDDMQQMAKQRSLF